MITIALIIAITGIFSVIAFILGEYVMLKALLEWEYEPDKPSKVKKFIHGKVIKTGINKYWIGWDNGESEEVKT